MNKENYTGLKLSKWLQDKGFKRKYELCWINTLSGWKLIEKQLAINDFRDKIPAYDILNDLCVKYAKELFEEDGVMKSYIDRDEEEAINLIPVIIMKCLQQGKKEEAEKYLQESCLFNPKNK